MPIIDKARYQGYLWYSDSKTPIVIDGDFSLALADTDNPFVVEGLLYSVESRESLTIRYIDGRYVIAKHVVDEDDFNSVNVDICEYLPHRMPGVDKLRFLQYWELAEDPLCCNMDTLVPTKRVFVGFSNIKK